MDDLAKLIQDIVSEYPKLNYDWRVRDLRNLQNPPRGSSEFYPPEELWNPYPGFPTIDIFRNSEYSNRDALIGEMMHYLPRVDPTFAQYKRRFADTLTFPQIQLDLRAWLNSLDDERTFEDWMEESQLDAYMRAGMFPKNSPDWGDALTAEQLGIIEEIRNYLGIKQ